MGFLSNFKKDLKIAKQDKATQINGKHLKKLLKKFKEERDREEKNLRFVQKLIRLLVCIHKKF